MVWHLFSTTHEPCDGGECPNLHKHPLPKLSSGDHSSAVLREGAGGKGAAEGLAQCLGHREILNTCYFISNNKVTYPSFIFLKVENTIF